MSLGSIVQQMKSNFAQSANAASVIFKKLDQMDRNKVPALQAAAKAIEPLIRQYLAENWSASGIESQSGDLYDAAVVNAQVVFEPTKFTVRFAPGTPVKVIRYGAALNYGAVHDSGSGRRLRKKLKQAGQTPTGGWQQPALRFFQLTAPQIAALNVEFNKVLETTLNKRAA